MVKVELVSHGRPLAISLPSNSNFKIKKVQRFLLISSKRGTAYTLVPRISNPYAEPATKATMPEEWNDLKFEDVE
jgi:hypothetical protein